MTTVSPLSLMVIGPSYGFGVVTQSVVGSMIVLPGVVRSGTPGPEQYSIRSTPDWPTSVADSRTSTGSADQPSPRSAGLSSAVSTGPDPSITK